MGTSAISKSGNEFHWNISGASYIRHLLIQLHLTPASQRISGVGGGDRMPSRMARNAGIKILEALEKNLIIEEGIQNEFYQGGIEWKPFVLENPVDDQTIFILNIQKKVRMLDKESKEWLNELALFFIESKGFEQL